MCWLAEDYPRTIAKFEPRFASEDACRAYLVQLRWSYGFWCPTCGSAKAWLVRAADALPLRVLRTTDLGHRGHDLSRHADPAAHVVPRHMVDTEASAKGLLQVLGLGSYETTWMWLHKLRRAMVRPRRDRRKEQRWEPRRGETLLLPSY